MTKKSNKNSASKPVLDIPTNFKTIILDFVQDLSSTFPEYKDQLEKYSTLESITTHTRSLFEYFISVFPERFFDILYQNEDIFKPESTINTCFLPQIDFKIFFQCQDITETTKKAIWKYLQLIMFTIMNSVKDKSKFGETMNLFEGINEKELQEKLGDTMKDITDFFSHLPGPGPDPDLEKKDDAWKEKFSHLFEGDQPPDFEKIHKQLKTMFGEKVPDLEQLKEECKTIFESETAAPDMDKIQKIIEEMFKASTEANQEANQEENKDVPQKSFFEQMPNPGNIHEHLKKLFDGKIGKLAKELAEEISGDLNDIFKKEGVEIKTTQDVLKHIIKNPTRIMELVKTIGAKLNTKMQNGDISQEEMMKEAAEMMAQMKNMGGQDQFSEILKNLTKNMGSMGKNAKIDMNAVSRFEKQMSTKERIRKNLELKRQQKEQEQFKLDANAKLQETQTPNHYVFKMGDEKIEKSSKPPTENLDELMKKLDLKNEVTQVNPVQTANKKKNKKKK